MQFIDSGLALVAPLGKTTQIFESVADQGPAGVLAAMPEQLAKFPAQSWRTENDGFVAIAEAIDALAVQVDCARVGWSRSPSPAESWPPCWTGPAPSRPTRSSPQPWPAEP
jgi:hypothetical protein